MYSPPYTNACSHCTYTARRTWSLWPWDSAEGKVILGLNQTGNWQMKNDFFFCAGTVLCALFRCVLRNVRVAGTRVSTHCRTVRRQNWTGKWPKTSIIANFSVRKSCVFIFGSLCCSLSPKTRVSDFQFFPDSEEDKSEYVDVQWTLILRTKKKMAAIGTLLFQQRIPQCLLIMSSIGWLIMKIAFSSKRVKTILYDSTVYIMVHCSWWLVNRVKRQEIQKQNADNTKCPGSFRKKLRFC